MASAEDGYPDSLTIKVDQKLSDNLAAHSDRSFNADSALVLQAIRIDYMYLSLRK